MSMSQQEDLVRKLYQALSMMACELKVSRSYGTGYKLSDSDIGLLKCIRRNGNAKACELSQYLGITCGAVTQLAKKLEQKGYLEPYRLAGNKKEVYYRLTGEGETACYGHDAYFGKLRTGVEQYAATLDEAAVQKITGLFDVIADSVAALDHCSIKAAAQGECHLDQETVKRCEKCQGLY